MAIADEKSTFEAFQAGMRGEVMEPEGRERPTFSFDLTGYRVRQADMSPFEAFRAGVEGSAPWDQPLTALDAAKEVLARPTKYLPWWGGAEESHDTYLLWDASKALEAGTATPEQEERIYQFFDQAQREKTLGYTAASILSNMPAFGVEFATGTAVAGKVGSKLAKTAVGAAVREAVEKTAGRIGSEAVKKGLGTAAKAGALAAGQQAVTEAGSLALSGALSDQPGSRITGEAYRRALPQMGLTEDEAGRLALVFETTTQDFLDALPQAVVSQYYESLSEHSGGAIAALPGIRGLQLRIAGLWKAKGGSVSELIEKVAGKLKWHGVLPELGEERINELLLASTPGMDEFGEYELPSGEQLAAELIAFSAAGGLMRGAGAALDATPFAQRQRLGPDGKPLSHEQVAEIEGAPSQAPQEPAQGDAAESGAEVAPGAEAPGEAQGAAPDVEPARPTFPHLQIEGREPYEVPVEEFVEKRPRPAPGDEVGVEDLMDRVEPREDAPPGISEEPSKPGLGGAEYPSFVYRGDAGEVLGVLSYAPPFGGQPGIVEVAVAPEARRQGVASALYEAAEAAGYDVDAATGFGGLSDEGARLAHARAIRKALAAGVDVPAEVRAGYEVSSEVTPEEAPDYATLPYQELRRLARERGLETPDRKKATLVQALQEAEKTQTGLRSTQSEVGAEDPVAVEIQAAREAEAQARAALEALGQEPHKPTPEGRAFGKAGREGADPKHVARWEQENRAYKSWRRKHDRLHKAMVEAGNRRIFLERDAGIAPQPGAAPLAAPLRAPSKAQPGEITPGVPVALERPETPPKRPTSIPEVVRSYDRVLQTAGSTAPIRYGRIPARLRAAGIYKPGEVVVRVNSRSNLRTAAHEVAHALDFQVYGTTPNPWTEGGKVSEAVRAELERLGRELYGDEKPTAGYEREGWAEFMADWLTTDAAAEKAPATTAWLEGPFAEQNPEAFKALQSAREATSAWRSQGATARAGAQIARPGVPEKLAEAREVVGRSPEALLDALLPLAEVSEETFEVASILRSTAPGVVEHMIERGMVDFYRRKVGPALADIRKLVAGRGRDFSIYLYARRARALWTDPNRPEGRNPGISLADAEQVIADLGTPQFQAAAEKLYEWYEGVMEYAAQASPRWAKLVETVRATDPGDYVPLKREFDAVEQMVQRAAKRGQGTGSLVSRLKGSARQIKDPVESVLAQATHVVSQAHHQVVRDLIVRASKMPGMGHILEEVPIERVPVAQREVADLLAEMQRAAKRQGVKISPEALAEFEDIMGEAVTLFAPARQDKSSDPIFPFYDTETDTLRWYEVDARLYRSLASIDHYYLPKAADLVLGKPARAFRLGTTGVRLVFSFLTNPMRDLRTLYQNSYSQANGAEILGYWVGAVVEAGIHAATGGKRASEWLDAYTSIGLQMTHHLALDTRPVKRAAHRLSQGQTVRYLDPGNLWDFVLSLFQIPEQATRLAEMKLVAREIGWKPGMPLDMETARKLVLPTRRVTTDFPAMGNLVRVYNTMVPFMGSSIGGVRDTVRAAKDHPARFVFRGLQVSAFALAMWWMVKDEEWYQELRTRERFAYWHFPVTINGEETILRIPRAHEHDLMFAALPEALADAAYRNDPERMAEWMEHAGAMVAPPLLPHTARIAAEQLANRDFFWDSPIVPRGMEQMPAEEQFNEYTTRAAILMARILPGEQSPRRVDHIMRSLVGGAGVDLVELLGLGPEFQGFDDEVSDVPLAGALFQRGGRIGTRPRSFEKLYDALDEARTLQASREHEETRSERTRRLMLSDAASAISDLTGLRAITPDREDRIALTNEALRIAKEALRMAESEAPVTDLARGRVTRQKKRAERRLERAERTQP